MEKLFYMATAAFCCFRILNKAFADENFSFYGAYIFRQVTKHINAVGKSGQMDNQRVFRREIVGPETIFNRWFVYCLWAINIAPIT